MTVLNASNRIEHVGDNATLIFPYNFKILAEAHLQVYVSGVLKTISTHYTVSGVGSPTGGNVTFIAPAPATAAPILFLRVAPATQESAYPVGSKFPSASHETVVDKLTMLMQQVIETFGRALKLKVTSTQENKEIDDLVALKHLRVKADASGIEMVDAPAGTVSFPITTSQGGTGKDNGIPAEGDLLVADATFVFSRLAKGATKRILQAGATTLSWVADLALDAAAFLGWDDVKLFRDAANILAQRNGANAQAWRLYETADGNPGANFTRLGIISQGAAGFDIATESLGTGAARKIRIYTQGVANLEFGTQNTIFLALDGVGTWFPTADASRSLGGPSNRWSALHLSESVRIGTNPATAGAVRLANNIDITGRNAANSTDITALRVNVNDLVEMGAALVLPAASGTPAQHAGYRESFVRGWAIVTMAGSADASFNVSSVTDTGTGQVTVNWDRDFATGNYAPVASYFHASATLVSRVGAITAGTVRVDTFDLSATLTDPTKMMVVGFGAQ